ncbi:hypothetical protein [Paenibacillus sp. HJGM_3]|uniref:hypothetical protein n=1 Tax=Paenibacillus sp. HJGM_3 TaxID=3379816 RepID=UPI00385A0A47
MAHVTLRPDLKTSSGEICDIMVDGRYVGTMALLFREGHRVAGSIQLDRDTLTGSERQETVDFLQGYVEQLVAAVQAHDCEVVVTYSPYDHIIASDSEMGDVQEFLGSGASETDWAAPIGGLNDYEEDDADLVDVDPDDLDTVQMLRDPSYYELVLVGESRNRVEYHIYDRDGDWIAEAFLSIRGTDVTGEVIWNYEPLEDEIEPVVELIVADFDEDEIDTIQLDMMHQGVILETIELAHEDLLGDDMADEELLEEEMMDDADDMDSEDYYPAGEHDYTVVLARDDGDAKMYDIYQQRHGGFPVGTATIDLSENGVSGYIEFRDSECSEDREEIGALLMQELDKEGDFDQVHLTMLLNNRPIDEIVYSTEQLH